MLWVVGKREEVSGRETNILDFRFAIGIRNRKSEIYNLKSFGVSSRV
jgi:hypothetical protein